MKLNNSGKNFGAKCLLKVTRTATVVDKYLYYFAFLLSDVCVSLCTVRSISLSFALFFLVARCTLYVYIPLHLFYYYFLFLTFFQCIPNGLGDMAV